MLSNKKILVVGLGLIGASYAQGLSRIGLELGGITRKKSTLDYALKHKFISHGSTEVEADYVSKFDIVVLALYPHILVEWIEKYQSFLRPGVILTDVCGVKASILAKIMPNLRKDIFFVPSHPMAGSEKNGIEAANCGIFRDANFIITPVMEAPQAEQTISQMAYLLGFRKVSILTPEEHDEMIGFLSQLTHCIAVALMDCKESSHLVDYTGDSFRDLTRIAAINEDMWTELFLENKDELLSQMDLFIEKIVQIRTALANSDSESLKEMMRLSTNRRNNFNVTTE